MKASERTIPFLLATVMLDSMGLGIIIPVLPRLLETLLGASPSVAAAYGGFLSLIYAVAQLGCAPILGSLSDRFGRRPVLLVSLASFGVDYLIMALAPTFFWLMLGRALTGISGATFGTAAAYIADVTPPERRAARIGLIGAAFGIGFILGPAAGGLLGAIGTRAPFYGSAALAFVNVVYGLLVLPESLTPERRRAFDWTRANVFGALHSIARYPGVTRLASAQFAWYVAFQALPTTWSFVTIAKFGWNAAAIGASLAFSGVLMAVVQGGVVEPVVKRVGERNAALLGLFFGTLGFAGYAFASASWMMYAASVLWSLGGLISPGLSALMSRETPPDAQGELQGAMGSLMGLAAVVGPILMTQLFAHYSQPETAWFPGASFAASATLGAIALAILTAIKTRGKT